MENLKHLQALEESEEERKKRRCQQGAGQIGQVGAAVAMIVVGAIYHDECTYSKGGINANWHNWLEKRFGNHVSESPANAS